MLVGDPVLRFCAALDGEESEEFIEGIRVMKKHPADHIPYNLHEAFLILTKSSPLPRHKYDLPEFAPTRRIAHAGPCCRSSLALIELSLT